MLRVRGPFAGVHSISPGNPLYRVTVGAIGGLIRSHFSSADSLPRSLGFVELNLDQQATLLSYVDNFRYLAIVSLLAVAIGFALTKVASGRRVSAR